MPTFGTDYCPISDLPVDTCAHCRQGTRALPSELADDGEWQDIESEASQGITARYTGACSNCGGKIAAGRTVIHPDGQGGWLCADCS